jgi:hypothetical protein
MPPAKNHWGSLINVSGFVWKNLKKAALVDPAFAKGVMPTEIGQMTLQFMVI